MAWIIPAISAITAIYGAVSSRNAAKKSLKQQKDAQKQQQDIYNQAVPSAKDYLAQSKQAINPTLNYYTSLLGGNRYAMQEAMAPELNALGHQFAGSAGAASSLYPRSGQGPSAAGKAREGYNAAVNDTMFQARPMAASALGSLGTGLAGLGYQGLGLGAGASTNIFNTGMQGRAEQGQYGQQAGQGLFNAYQAYLMSRGMASPSAGGETKGGSIYGGSTGKAGSQSTPFNPPPPQYGPSSGAMNTRLPNSGATQTNPYTPSAGGAGGMFNPSQSIWRNRGLYPSLGEAN